MRVRLRERRRVSLTGSCGGGIAYGSPYAVPLSLPTDDRVIVFLAGLKISESRMCGAVHDRFNDSRSCGKVHVRDPHGDHVEARGGSLRRKAARLADHIYRDCVTAFSVHNGSKIVFHENRLSYMLFFIG